MNINNMWCIPTARANSGMWQSRSNELIIYGGSSDHHLHNDYMKLQIAENGDIVDINLN